MRIDLCQMVNIYFLAICVNNAPNKLMQMVDGGGHELELPLQIEKDGLTAWVVMTCKRLSPHTRGVVFNMHIKWPNTQICPKSMK